MDTEHRTTVARDHAIAIVPDRPARSHAGAYQLPLPRLYERFDAVAKGRASADGVDLHQLIVDRLAANRELAEGAGWTACALEREGGSGRLRLMGVAPFAEARSIVPDWTEGVAAEALASSERARRCAPPDAARHARPPWPRLVRG